MTVPGKLLDVHWHSSIIVTVGLNGGTNLAAILIRLFPLYLFFLHMLAADRMFPKHFDAGRASIDLVWNAVILLPPVCRTG